MIPGRRRLPNKLVNEFFESRPLLVDFLQLCNWPQRPLGDRGPADHVGQGEDMLLDLACEAEQTHHLCHPSAGDPLPPRDLGLSPGLAGFELTMPLLGLLEELGHARRAKLPVPPEKYILTNIDTSISNLICKIEKA
jgi:hypothetical protein